MRRALGVLAFVVAAVCFMLTLATDGAEAQSTTSTTTPPASTQPMLPTTGNSSMPQTGLETGQLAGLAISAILIGYGICSIGRGVEIDTVP